MAAGDIPITPPPVSTKSPGTESECPTPPYMGNALDTAHAEEWGDQPTIRFFPEHFLSEVTAMFLVFALLTALCIFLPAELDIKANPMATPSGSKPEWYFLFLYAYLHFVPPIVGTFTPMVGMALLALLPFLDRNPERRPSKRPVAIISSIVLLIVIVALSILGLLE